MRNFFLIIRKYNVFIVFLLLQVLSIYLLVNNNSYQREAVVSTSNEVVGRIYVAYSEVSDYLKLGMTNRLLAEENARLRSGDSTSFYRMSILKTAVNDTVYKQQYEYITARVINNSVSKVNNYITLDAGSLKGIKPDMPVISSTGVVGVVKDVSPHFSTVMSVLNSNTRISAKFTKNNYFGSAMWMGGSPQLGVLNDIPSHAPVNKGDTVVTTSYSKYPAGIMVGLVYEVGQKSVSFKDLKIKFSTDFQNLSYVYVVRDLLKTERDSLEAKTVAADVK
jgi:rod shape-determining protein MreC